MNARESDVSIVRRTIPDVMDTSNELRFDIYRALGEASPSRSGGIKATDATVREIDEAPAL